MQIDFSSEFRNMKIEIQPPQTFQRKIQKLELLLHLCDMQAHRIHDQIEHTWSSSGFALILKRSIRG